MALAPELFYSAAMALSDREKRLLAEMEAALATDDPRLQSTLAGTTLAKSRPRLLISALVVVAGLATIFTGLIAQLTLIGVAGFLIALAGLISALRSISAPGALRAPKAKKGNSAFSDRIQERWDRRNFDQ